jgi:hypothetical protein
MTSEQDRLASAIAAPAKVLAEYLASAWAERDEARAERDALRAYADELDRWCQEHCRACRDEEFASKHAHDCGITRREVIERLRALNGDDE